jgi:hypothetical protein
MSINPKQGSLLFVVFYLVACFILSLLFLHYILFKLPTTYIDYKLFFSCTGISAIAGVFYCLRGVYLNYCVKSNWDTKWMPWYMIRPFTSLISGGASYIFLKAGLLVLDAKVQSPDANLGFFALAFIAGLNVDKFITKIEEVAEVTWGISKSRASTNDKS